MTIEIILLVLTAPSWLHFKRVLENVISYAGNSDVTRDVIYLEV